MRYAVLGTIQLVTPAGALRPPGEKQRLLLALLVCQAPRVVGTDRLLDAVWGEAQPANPAALTLERALRLGAESTLTASGADGDEALDADPTGPVPSA